MVALLKQKSKIQVQQKPRVKYPVKNIFKKHKPDPSLSQSQKDVAKSMFDSEMTDKTVKKIQPTVLEQYEEDN